MAAACETHDDVAFPPRYIHSALIQLTSGVNDRVSQSQ